MVERKQICAKQRILLLWFSECVKNEWVVLCQVDLKPGPGFSHLTAFCESTEVLLWLHLKEQLT